MFLCLRSLHFQFPFRNLVIKFDQGETFDWPERVPFRLTHNMLDAMGPLGVEGTFRKACEATLRVVRSHKDTFVSVLSSFVYDPLVEWSKPSRGAARNQATTGEVSNEKVGFPSIGSDFDLQMGSDGQWMFQALVHLRDIERRIDGAVRKYGKATGLPLAVEGQVEYLIQEATNVDNLAQMYIGWAAYM